MPLRHTAALLVLVLVGRGASGEAIGTLPHGVFLFIMVVAALSVRPFDARPLRGFRLLVVAAGVVGVLLLTL
jgi:hypothetical protein